MQAAAPKPAPLELQGRRVVVLGLARSGQAAAELLHAHGARVVGVDEGGEAPALFRGPWAAKFLAEGHAAARTAVLDAASLLVLSPGIPTTHALVRAARERRLPILAEIELAYRLCAAPVIAVTGSKGKSTTTALVGSLLDAAGVEHVVAGNIGLPFSAVVGSLPSRAWAVLEISSFQLETVDLFHARAAVLLAITPDHLDRYASMEEYAAAKARITRHQTAADLLVVDPEDPWSAGVGRSAAARVVGFGRLWEGRGVERDGDALVWRQGAEREELAAVTDVPLLGEHNVRNAMAALAVVRGLGLWNAAARQGLRQFAGLEYRMQPCGEIGGIRIVNDAKSTTVESVRAAVRGVRGPVLLALGGRNKGLDFTALRADLQAARVVLVFGEAAPDLERELAGAAPLQRVGTLDELLRRALELGRPGDTLLFSPGCTSFDMFRNAEERGHRFAAAVERLRLERSREGSRS